MNLMNLVINRVRVMGVAATVVMMTGLAGAWQDSGAAAQPGGAVRPAGAPQPAGASQPGSVGPVVPAAEAEPVRTAPVWSNADVQKVAEALIGRWTSADKATGTKAGQGTLVATFGAIEVVPGRDGPGLTDLVYYELVSSDKASQPLSSGVFRLVKTADGVVARRYGFSFEVLGPVFSGVWAVPFEHRPKLQAEWLEPVLDLTLSASGGGFRSASAAQGPVAAPQMGFDQLELSLAVSGDTLELSERLVSFEGGLVVGPAGSSAWKFRKAPAIAAVMSTADGLMVFDTGTGSEGEALVENGLLSLEYTGWAAGESQPIITSKAGSPGFTTKVPFRKPGEGLMEGLNQGLVGIRKGSRRWLVIPGPLAYGDQPPRRVGVGATLVWAVDAVDVFPPQPDAPEGSDAGGAVPPAAQGTGG